MIKTSYSSINIKSSFDEVLINKHNDEDMEKLAVKLFVEVYTCLEKLKILLKNEMRGYFQQERLSLIKRSVVAASSSFIDQTYDFEKVPIIAYLRRRSL